MKNGHRGAEDFAGNPKINKLVNRLKAYDAPQKAREAGVYPYFRVIESEQDTEVKINGKPCPDVWVQ